jgi:preprotein translocase subunit YajC
MIVLVLVSIMSFTLIRKDHIRIKEIKKILKRYEK